MAIFNLTGISLNNKQENRTGKSSAYLVGSSYDYNTYRYPEDIGNYDKGHYMVIHINEQQHTKDPSSTPGNGDVPTIIQNRRTYGTPTIQSDTGKTAVLLSKGLNSVATPKISGALESGTQLINEFTNGGVDKLKNGLTGENGVRTIKRTTDTIALYMPDTLNFVHNQGYSDLSLGGTLAAGAMAAGASIADGLKGQTDAKEAAKKVLGNLSPFFAQYAANKFGDFGKVAFASSFGMVQNPMLELLYQAPEFRSFRFDFMFYPRSEKEATEVQKILNRLRFHQAPEIRKENTSFFLVPPSEFDIKFYYNGTENPNIPKISTCVLQSIDIDYAPNGFAAYEVPGVNTPETGKTGMPVAIRLSLQFKETEIMTKDHFATKIFGGGTAMDTLYDDTSMDWYE